MKLKYLSFPVIIILVGIVFTLYLQSKAIDGVYFSGDAGLKVLLAKQLGSGILQFNLIVPEIAWIEDLWNNGLYPYNEPYVYNVANKYYITFPYTFPLVTAPFYSWFGERGLYIVPLVSCWLIWLVFYLNCIKLKLNNFLTSLGLSLLIFSSYLTIYTAMYWEHTLAVALCFTGLSLWCIFSYPHGTSNLTTIIAGCLIGLSVWFRPEFLCIVAVITGVIITAAVEPLLSKTFIAKIIPLKEISFLAHKKIIFLSSMFLSVAEFFFSNKLIYGYALGIHGIQVVEKPSVKERIIDAWSNFSGMTQALPEYLPIIIFVFLYLCFYFLLKILSRHNIEFDFKLVAIYLGCLLFTIAVSILVPVGTAGLIAGGKQWGVRFLLILVPISILVALVELNYLKTTSNKLIYNIALITFISLGIVGFYTNTVQATQYLDRNNQAIQPAVEFLGNSKHNIVATSHEFVGQALEASTIINNPENIKNNISNKIFFNVPTESEIIQLSQALITQGKTKFTYICYPHRRCDLPKTDLENLRFSKNNQQYQIKFNNLGKFGKYPIYEVGLSMDN